MGKFIDLTGKRYGRLTVIKKAEIARDKGTKWHCLCDCGNVTIVGVGKLNNGHTKSCGCLMRETVKSLNEKHGESKTKLYLVWLGMKSRCNNPNGAGYKDYGGRGIKISNEWNDYLQFKNWALANGYSKELTIERIDVNGNYEPSNCTWISKSEQSKNRRMSINITYDNQTKSLKEWSRVVGVSYYTLHTRLYEWGMTVDEAFTCHKIHGDKISFNGQNKTLKEWAKHLQIPYSTLIDRLNIRKWPIEKALTTPTRKRSI